MTNVNVKGCDMDVKGYGRYVTSSAMTGLEAEATAWYMWMLRAVIWMFRAVIWMLRAVADMLPARR
eukprot:1196400-Prorocentrum_minimum.AAC.3